jgi:serine/threonine-protein kinase
VTAALKIGRYEIEGELGAGGMATIYLALDPFMKRKVAIKVLPRQFTHDPQFRIRFQREAEVIAALEHPHIVAIYDIGEDDDQPYIVMRFMTGGTLLQRVRAKPLAVAELAPTVNRIAEALDEAHAQNVVHRDLKPSNILFDGKGHAYLSDFGIAKVSEAAATFTGTGVIGTPEYMSPEQARGIKDLDGRSDVYSLGVVIFHALTGQLPYKADTPMGAAVAHITEPVPNILTVRPDLPPACDRIIRCAMAKNPDDRYPTAGELAYDLAQLAAGKLERKPYIVRARAITRSSAETEPAASQPPTTLTPETSKDVVVLHTLKGHMHHVVGVAFGPAGQLLASGSTDKTVRLWNPRLGQPVSTLQKHTDGVWSVAFSPDGSLLASGGRDAIVVVWDVAAGVALRTLKHKGGVTSVAFSPDGSTLAAQRSAISRARRPLHAHGQKRLCAQCAVMECAEGRFAVHRPDLHRAGAQPGWSVDANLARAGFAVGGGQRREVERRRASGRRGRTGSSRRNERGQRRAASHACVDSGHHPAHARDLRAERKERARPDRLRVGRGLQFGDLHLHGTSRGRPL